MVAEDVNLIPLLNIFTIVIPFVLLTAVFAKTAIIDIFLPQERAGVAEKSSAPAEVFTIMVTERGFQLGGIGRGVVVPKKEGKYDVETLREEVVKVKDAHPSHEEVIIMLKSDIPYDLVVQVMDAARDATRTEGGKEVVRTLFPFVSLGEAK